MGKTMKHRSKPAYWRRLAGTSKAARARREAFSDLTDPPLTHPWDGTMLMACAACGNEDGEKITVMTEPVLRGVTIVGHRLTGYHCLLCRTSYRSQPQGLGDPTHASTGAER